MFRSTVRCLRISILKYIICGEKYVSVPCIKESVGSKNEKAGNFGQLKSGKTVLKIEGTICPIKDRPRLVNSTSIFFLILTKEPE